jgi:hypothetical protein
MDLISGFRRKLLVIYYDSEKKINHEKTLLTDSIYILAHYAIIWRYNWLGITNEFEIKLLRVRRGGKSGKIMRFNINDDSLVLNITNKTIEIFNIFR